MFGSVEKSDLWRKPPTVRREARRPPSHTEGVGIGQGDRAKEATEVTFFFFCLSGCWRRKRVGSLAFRHCVYVQSSRRRTV